MSMTEECAAALLGEFKYIPDEDGGEKWIVYHDEVLIVLHPARLIRCYKRGATDSQDYYEIDPTPWR